MTPKAAWADFFKRQKKVKGKESIHIHEMIVRPEDDFPAGEFYAYDVSHHVFKLVGLNNQDAYLTHAYGFDASKYSEQDARRWVEKFASGLEPEDDTNLLKFKQNFRVVHHTNKETGVKTCDLLGVECAVVGEWNGRQYSEEDLTRSITNDKEVHRSVKPKFKIEHVYQGPSMGDIENYREGPEGPEHCLCDIYGVPFELYGEITALRYTGLSPEFYRTYVDPSTGKDYDRVFSGLALLGVQTPAMAKMKPLMEAETFSMDPNSELICLGQPKPELMKAMAKSATSQLMTYGTGASQADEEPDLEVNEMKTEELEALQAKLKKDQDALTAATEANDTMRKGLIEREVNSAMKGLISEGRIDPKEVDEQTKNLMALSDDGARGAVLKALLAIPEGTFSKKEEAAPNPEGEPKKDENENPLPADEQFGEVVDKYMKEHELPFDQYPDALAACEKNPRNKELVEKCAEQFKGDAPAEVTKTLG